MKFPHTADRSYRCRLAGSRDDRTGGSGPALADTHPMYLVPSFQQNSVLCNQSFYLKSEIVVPQDGCYSFIK